MSSTRNSTSSTGPDVATGAYLGQARNAAQTAYNTTLSQPYYSGPRTAGIDPYQQMGADQSQQIANLFGPASQQLMSQAGGYAPASQYFNQAINGGQYGTGQQYGVANGVSGAQNMLANGANAQDPGLNTLYAANSMFGQGAQGQQALAGQLPSYLQANQGLLNTNAVQGLDTRIGAGDAAQSRIGGYGQQAAGAGFGAVQNALQPGAPDASAYMNPYQQQVIDATRAQFGQTRDLTNRSISDQATAAGAFGGSREAVARGAALAGVARDENSQIANLLQGGYTDSMNRAQSQQQYQGGLGQSLFGQGLNALGQQAGSGDAALQSRLNLYGQGLNNLGQAGMSGTNALYNNGINSGQYLAGFGNQNAQSLFGAGNNASQFLSQQGMAGANQLGSYGAGANSSLFNAGLNGTDALGQYGALFRDYAQQGINNNQAAIQDPITRQNQALQQLFQGVNGGGTTSTTPMYSNGLASGLGYASAGLGLYNQFRNTFGGGGTGVQIPNVNIPTVNIPYTGNTPGLTNSYSPFSFGG